MSTTIGPAPTQGPASETSWEDAPELLEGAQTLNLTAERCDLEYWLRYVAQGTLLGLVNGHRADSVTPSYMREPGPLRDALIEEFAFRSIAEEKATRALTDLVDTAPTTATMEFYATQLVDEARHSRVFKGHLVELGVPLEDLDETVERVAGLDRDRVLVPLEDFAAPVRTASDFIGGVVILTVLVEGVLAPAAELSERKWRPLDPAAADVERAAGIDEIRHLAVGSATVREHLSQFPQDKARLEEFVRKGRELWEGLPIFDMLVRREEKFQAGMQQFADVIGDYEVWSGRRLIDTTPEERILAAGTWAAQMQDSRLAYMGLNTAEA